MLLCRLEAIATRLEAIATGLEAIATGLEAIAIRLEAIAIRFLNRTITSCPLTACQGQVIQVIDVGAFAGVEVDAMDEIREILQGCVVWILFGLA